MYLSSGIVVSTHTYLMYKVFFLPRIRNLCLEMRKSVMTGEMEPTISKRTNQEGNWYWTIKQLRSYSLSNSLISQDAFELLANYTKTNTKLIPYFDQEYLFQPK
jgi:hypothetical protein